MSIMNKLLADIVVAYGGTVSNPSNRNQLLRDWLDAVTSGEPESQLISSDSVALFSSEGTPLEAL